MSASSPVGEFNVRAFGAQGDGAAVDSPAINAAIAAAAAAGGGIVRVPAGTYLSFSIRLRSHIVLQLDAGATLLAADPARHAGAYDPPEPNDWGDRHQYQDFGHSHWHNSLIWGEELTDIAIAGPGRIDGRALAHNLSYSAGPRDTGPDGTSAAGHSPPIIFAPDPIDASPAALADALRCTAQTRGHANKAIALKRCRHVALRGFSILRGGHFALLATGVDDLAIEELQVDTNRDGLDLDGCRNVRISRCRVNSPHDDAIVLKSSFALGELRPCEQIAISHCTVSGFDVGSMLDGTRRRTVRHAPDLDGPTGRIKLGTESTGDFRHIRVTDCVFERSRGFAIESVDGGVIEDVVAVRLVMREITSSPIFVRLGNRARGPQGRPVGAIRGVQISQVTVDGADGRFPVLLAGLPEHPIADVKLEDIRLVSEGGITPAEVAAQPAGLVNRFFLRGDEPGLTGPRDPLAVPLRERAYPEPSMFGLLPASVLYARAVKQLTVVDLHATFTRPDTRPAVVLDQVGAASFLRVATPPSHADVFVLRRVGAFDARGCSGLADTCRSAVTDARL